MLAHNTGSPTGALDKNVRLGITFTRPLQDLHETFTRPLRDLYETLMACSFEDPSTLLPYTFDRQIIQSCPRPIADVTSQT